MVSLWTAINKNKQDYPSLEKNLEVDVVSLDEALLGLLQQNSF